MNAADARKFEADVAAVAAAMNKIAFALAWETGRAFSINAAVAAATSSDSN